MMSRIREVFLAKRMLAKKNYDCYIFLFPFLAIYAVFTLAPVVSAIRYSFTYFNILEPAQFIGWQNYSNIFANNQIFITVFKNTMMIAMAAGPIGYLASLLLAWSINELKPLLRAIMVTIMYAPSISGGAFLIWGVLFSGDMYGYFNSILIRLGITNQAIQFLTDTRYMIWVTIVISVWMSLGPGFLAFVAGFRTLDKSFYEAGYVEGIKNRWQELWFITLPMIKPQLLFGAVMSITASLAAGEISMQIFGIPSTDYAADTVLTHIVDHGRIRFEMGYASAVATLLFFFMIGVNQFVQKMINKVGR